MAMFDAILGVTIVVVAIRVLATRDLFEGVVLFIVFGLLMSLAWTRLEAVDVALAEAAIGAGLTGALFLNALGHAGGHRALTGDRARVPALAIPIVGLAVSLATVVGIEWASSPRAVTGSGLADAQLARSGVSNPVTAVLLNIRGYDTLLEIVVLTVAVVCVWALGPTTAAAAPRAAAAGPVLLAFVRILIPVMGIVAGYLLWIGTSAPGGAFHAGAILGASGVLLVVSGVTGPLKLRTAAHRVVIVAGAAGFLGVSAGMMLTGRLFLEYPPAWAPMLILAIETLITLSTGAILVALFSGVPPEDVATGVEADASGATRGREPRRRMDGTR